MLVLASIFVFVFIYGSPSGRTAIAVIGLVLIVVSGKKMKEEIK
jgi:hypothetical protein